MSTGRQWAIFVVFITLPIPLLVATAGWGAGGSFALGVAASTFVGWLLSDE